jgi:hypothetical protein
MSRRVLPNGHWLQVVQPQGAKRDGGLPLYNQSGKVVAYIDVEDASEWEPMMENGVVIGYLRVSPDQQ